MFANDDKVVEDGKIDRFTGQGEAAGDLAVERAGRGIAARMIVGEDDSSTSVERGIGDDLAEREVGPAFVTIMAGQVNAPGLVVDMGNPDMFGGGVTLGEAIGEKPSGRL